MALAPDGTIYVDKEVLDAYLVAKLDGVFNGTFEEWRQAAKEAAEIYAADPWVPGHDQCPQDMDATVDHADSPLSGTRIGDVTPLPVDPKDAMP